MKNKLLRNLSGAIAILTAILAIVSYFALLSSISGYTPAEGEESKIAGLIIMILLLGTVYLIGMIVIAVTCLISSIVIFANVKDKKANYIAAAVLGIFDVIGAIVVIILAQGLIDVNAGWFFVFLIPFVADFIMRILCAIMCKRSEPEWMNE